MGVEFWFYSMKRVIEVDGSDCLLLIPLKCILEDG